MLSPPPLGRTATLHVLGRDSRALANAEPVDFDCNALELSLPGGMGMRSPLALKIIRLFAAESAKLLGEIERACAAGDAQALFHAAHSLKSSAATVGACAIAGIAKEIEATARAGWTAALAAHPANLRLAHERFCATPEVLEMLAPDRGEQNAA